MIDALTFDQFEKLIGGRIDRTFLPNRKFMQVDKEFLEAELTSIRAQKEQFARLFQQAIGAEAALMSLLQRLDSEPQPPMEGTADE